MNPFSEYVKASEFSFGSTPSATAGANARGRNKPKSRGAATPGAAANDTPAASSALVSDVQLASGDGVVVAAAGANARGRNKPKSRGAATSGAAADDSQSTLMKTSLSEDISATGVPRKNGAALTGKSRPQQPSLSGLESMQADSSVADVHPRQKGGARSNARGAAPLVSSFEGLHDNCRDAAFGAFPAVLSIFC